MASIFFSIRQIEREKNTPRDKAPLLLGPNTRLVPFGLLRFKSPPKNG